jgi:hypothetical protein
MRRLVLVALGLVAPAAHAVNDGFFFQSIPTLDEVGLGLLIALVAGVAGWAVRRKSRQ